MRPHLDKTGTRVIIAADGAEHAIPWDPEHGVPLVSGYFATALSSALAENSMSEPDAYVPPEVAPSYRVNSTGLARFGAMPPIDVREAIRIATVSRLAKGRYRIGHGVMKDALDIDGIYDAIRNAGLDLPERARAADLDGKLVNVFIKCEADKRASLRGRRQIMLDDSDVHHHRHAKGAVGGVAAAAIGDPCVFVSVDAMHQGPHGGGPVIAIVDVGE